MKKTVFVLILSLLLFAACVPGPTPSPTVVIPAQPTTPPEAPTPTQAPPTTTPTPAPTATIQPSPTPPPTSLPEIGEAFYLDDRSTPAALMLSYFNAINRREYLRAYSYYTNFTDLGTLDEFSAGYEDTQSISVVIGDISSEGAAGSIFSTVPMVLNVTTTTGVDQKFAACYVLRLPQPGNFGAPPVTPLHIERGTAQSVALTTSDADALASACSAPDFPTGPEAGPPVVEEVSDLQPSNYVDNRSGPVEVISSMLNAINRKEYARAYTYWQESPGSFDSFTAGYEDTESVTAIFGTAEPDAGAGQIYYALPVALFSTLNSGIRQTYIGCYVLHLSQPGIQGTLPFEPLGIKSAVVNQVANDTDIPTGLATACN